MSILMTSVTVCSETLQDSAIFRCVAIIKLPPSLFLSSQDTTFIFLLPGQYNACQGTPIDGKGQGINWNYTKVDNAPYILPEWMKD